MPASDGRAADADIHDLEGPHVRSLSVSHTVMADVIVNHVSSRSSQFADAVARGDASPWAAMFLTLGSVFPDGATEAELAGVYRPGPGLPFTAMSHGGRSVQGMMAAILATCLGVLG